MSFLSQKSPEQPPAKSKGSNWPFTMPYDTEYEAILLDSKEGSPEASVQYVKTHMMQMKSESGKPYTKRVLCPDYKRDLATEDSICPIDRKWASMSKEEQDAFDWRDRKVYIPNTELPMTFLIRRENENGEMEEFRSVRFSPSRKEKSTDECSVEQKFLTKVVETAIKEGIGEDTKGLKFVLSRGPEETPKPAGIGELGLPMTGISYFELDDDNPEHQAYTMSEILEAHVVTDEEKIAELMKPFED